jgi:carbamoylphosphate synthase large subunit
VDQPKYILVVNHIVSSVFHSVEKLGKQPDLKGLRVLLISNNPGLAARYAEYSDKFDYLPCDFSTDDAIKTALGSYMENIVGVICRGDKHIQYLRKISRLLPPSVKVSTPEALEKATNKRLMRKAFSDKYPQITPAFMSVRDASDQSIEEIEAIIAYPMIIKPANLYSSLLIQTCANRQELQIKLKSTFDAVGAIYEREGIIQSPQIIVEEYLEGDFYSTDVFILSTGKVYCTPLVGYIPAKKMGIDDFFLYKRFIPSGISEPAESEAFTAASKAVEAVGLQYSAAHVELIDTKNGWKVIELGPRLGRFRNIMYRLGFGIDLSLTDLQIHLGIVPDIPTDLKEYCAAYSIYPRTEGTLRELTGIEELSSTGLVKSMRVLAKAGDRCLFAKNGGHALMEFIISSPSQKRYLETTAMVEEKVRVIID